MRDSLDPETEAARLESVEQYLEYLRTSNPYYDWLGADVLSVERGRVRFEQPHTDKVRPPEVGPTEGINGGVLVTLADAAGMAAIIAEVLEPIPLATTSVDMTFHDGVNERHIIESEVVDMGSTLATSRVRVYPETELESEDPDLIASGDTTARLFEEPDYV